MAPIRIAVIGAGMAGLKAASTLHHVGMQVTVFEKSRGMGGRLASRRTDFGHFNHGAQYVTARHPGFNAFLRSAEQCQAVRNWHPVLHRGGDDRHVEVEVEVEVEVAAVAAAAVAAPATAPKQAPVPSLHLPETTNLNNPVMDEIDLGGNPARDRWYRGAPQMNKLISPLIAPFDIRKQHRIINIDPVGPRRFMLHDDLDGAFGPFDGVIVTAPAPQTSELLRPLSSRFAPIADVVMAPCWAVMVAFKKPLPTAFDAMVHPTRDISWAARSNHPDDLIHQRTPDPWVLHASPQWSRDHLEEDKERIIEKLLGTLQQASGVKLPDIETVQAHRWRYARTEAPLGHSHLNGMNGRIIAAGDWCLGARVEAAWRSGQCAAHAMIATLIG